MPCSRRVCDLECQTSKVNGVGNVSKKKTENNNWFLQNIRSRCLSWWRVNFNCVLGLFQKLSWGATCFFQAPPAPGHTWSQRSPTLRTPPPHCGLNTPWRPGQVKSPYTHTHLGHVVNKTPSHHRTKSACETHWENGCIDEEKTSGLAIHSHRNDPSGNSQTLPMGLAILSIHTARRGPPPPLRDWMFV